MSKKYRVNFVAQVNQVITVEADSETEAAELAWDELETSLCWQDEDKFDLGDFDLVPDSIMEDD